MAATRWMRLTWRMTSFRTAFRLLALLILSALLLDLGYNRWTVSWLGNIAATVIVAGVTAVIIDRRAVRRQRADTTASLASGRQRVESCCNELVNKVNDIRAEVYRARPEAPHWIAGGGLTSAGVEDSWNSAFARLEDAVNGWAVLTAYPSRSLHMRAVRQALDRLRAAHTKALDECERLAVHMKERVTLESILGGPAPQPDPALSNDVEAALGSSISLAEQAVASINGLKSSVTDYNMTAHAARRHPFRLPRWLQFTTLLSIAIWAVVLVASWILPNKFPDGFLEDNLLNTAANVTVAFFVGALTIALVQARRVLVATITVPPYAELQNLLLRLSCITAASELRPALIQAVDPIIDLTATIQNESPSAELSFWTNVVTGRMRRIIENDEQLLISEANAVDAFAGLLRPTGNHVLDGDTEALLANAREGARTQPSAPSRELVALLEDMLELTRAAGEAAGAYRA